MPHDNSSFLLGDPFILNACDISIANCSTPLQTQSHEILNSKEVTEAPAVANGSESPSVSVVGVDNSLEIANETLNLPSTSRDLPGTSSNESHDACISNNPRFYGSCKVSPFKNCLVINPIVLTAGRGGKGTRVDPSKPNRPSGITGIEAFRMMIEKQEMKELEMRKKKERQEEREKKKAEKIMQTKKGKRKLLPNENLVTLILSLILHMKMIQMTC